MDGEQEITEIEAIDVDIAPLTEREAMGAMGAMLAIFTIAALIIVAVLLVGGGESSDVASGGDVDAVQSETASSADSVDDEAGDGDSVDTTTTQGDEDFEFEEEALDFEFALDSASSFAGGPGGVIFDGTQFVGVGYGPNGPQLRTSTDGLTWDERPFPGVSDEANINQIVEFGGTFAAVVEIWPEFTEEEFSPFDSPPSPTLLLTVSEDLDTWTTTELSVPQAEGRGVSFGGGLALGEAGIVIPLQSYAQGPDELGILSEAGLLGEDEWENYCGLDVHDDSIDVLLCDHSEFEEPSPEVSEELERRFDEAETDEERLEIEAELEELFSNQTEVVATLTSSDPIYAELRSIFEGSFEDDSQIFALVGPVDGQLTTVSLPGTYVMGLAEIDGSFVLSTGGFDGELSTASIYASQDGLTWTRTGSPGTGEGGGSLVVVGSALLATTYTDDGSTVLQRSTDRGATWTAVELETSLFQAYPQVVSGPAGAVVVMEGLLEPASEAFESEAIPVGDLVVTRDGFTLTVPFDESTPVILTGPAGELIYELSLDDLDSSDGNIDGVVRSNPVNENPTFLDPATGENLVTFTEEDFENFESQQHDGFAEEEFLEGSQSSGTEVFFSADGEVWTQISDDRLTNSSNNSSTSPVAVGDDDVIFVRNTYSEPPAELFAFEAEGRDPTHAELSALDEWEISGGGNAMEFFAIELG